MNVEALDQSKRAPLEELRFADAAKLYLGEADPDSVAGIADPSSSYALKVAWEGNAILFTLKDEQGHAGTLVLELPDKISIFEVDPRDAPDQGTGPSLYKEWKLTGKSPAQARRCRRRRRSIADADRAGQGQFLHQPYRLRALDAGDAGAEGELFPVRRSGAGALSAKEKRAAGHRDLLLL